MTDPATRFTLRFPDGREKVVCDAAVVRLGRHSSSDVIVRAHGVSRHHAEIRRDANRGWTLHDSGSVNGTKLNGKAAKGDALADGDVIALDNYEIVFHTGHRRRRTTKDVVFDSSETGRPHTEMIDLRGSRASHLLDQHRRRRIRTLRTPTRQSGCEGPRLRATPSTTCSNTSWTSRSN